MCRNIRINYSYHKSTEKKKGEFSCTTQANYRKMNHLTKHFRNFRLGSFIGVANQLNNERAIRALLIAIAPPFAREKICLDN